MGTKVDSMSNYATRARRMPYLSAEEELRLARQWRDHRDPDAARGLVEAHLRLVLRLAQKYRSYGLPVADLVSEGNLGLMDALERFDPELGHRFATYASYWIRSAMREHIVRSQSIVGVGGNAKRRRALFRVGDKDRPKLERDVALDATSGDSGSFLDRLACDREDQEESLGQRQVEELLRTAVDSVKTNLDARERRILEQRLFADDEEEKSLAELGQGFGVSRERVRQLEVGLKRKLKAGLLAVSHDFATLAFGEASTA